MNEIHAEKKSKVGPCALCLQVDKLSDSHIIPNAYFRDMKKRSSGKLIAMDTAPNTPIKSSQDSLSQHLLCEACEIHFSKWETPWIHKLRKTAKLFTKDVGSVDVASFDYQTLRSFLLSIIWRAAVCSRPEFSHVRFPPDVLEGLRLNLLAGTAPEETVIGNRVRRLVDPTGELDIGVIDKFVFTPIQLSTGGLQGYQLFFGGYIVDFLTSKVTRSVANLRGFVRDKAQLTIPAAPFEREPTFMRMAMYIMDKHQSRLAQNAPSKENIY